MNPAPAALVLLASLAAPSMVSAQAVRSTESMEISSLHAALSAGDLLLSDVRGTGTSSGTALNGTLQNTTNRAIRIAVQFARGIYFANRTARSQSMLATAIYGPDGQYWERDDVQFIEVPARGTTGVTLYAYCVDFELDNPSSSDGLDQRSVPDHLADITRKIINYEKRLVGDEDSPNACPTCLVVGTGESAGGDSNQVLIHER